LDTKLALAVALPQHLLAKCFGDCFRVAVALAQLDLVLGAGLSPWNIAS
jgi:hypothetical protein